MAQGASIISDPVDSGALWIVALKLIVSVDKTVWTGFVISNDHITAAWAGVATTNSQIKIERRKI